MRSFAIFLGLIALGLLGIAVFAYPAWELTQAMGLDFKFHRVASRIAMLTLLVGFVFVARRLKVADKAMLETLKPGAKVEFQFREKSKGKYVVTQVKP